MDRVVFSVAAFAIAVFVLVPLADTDAMWYKLENGEKFNARRRYTPATAAVPAGPALVAAAARPAASADADDDAACDGIFVRFAPACDDCQLYRIASGVAAQLTIIPSEPLEAMTTVCAAEATLRPGDVLELRSGSNAVLDRQTVFSGVMGSGGWFTHVFDQAVYDAMIEEQDEWSGDGDLDARPAAYADIDCDTAYGTDEDGCHTVLRSMYVASFVALAGALLVAAWVPVAKAGAAACFAASFVAGIVCWNGFVGEVNGREGAYEASFYLFVFGTVVLPGLWLAGAAGATLNLPAGTNCPAIV